MAIQLLGYDPMVALNPAVRSTMSRAGALMAGVDPDKQQGPWDAFKRWITPGKTSHGFDFIDLNPLNEPTKYNGGIGLAMTQKMVMNENVTDSQDVGMLNVIVENGV